MTDFAQSERAGLSDTFLQVGPDAPTLSGDWTTRDLAVHLVVRETRPDAAAGMFLPPLHGHLESVHRKYAALPWEQLVQQVRGGPPRLSVFSLPGVDELANLGEFFVHHEDVLRAGDNTPASSIPRELPDGEQAALWGVLPRLGRLTLRASRVGVVAESPGHGRRALRSPRDDHGNVVLTGAPGEILLYIYGRQQVADVQLDGADRDLAAFGEATLGF